MRAAAAAFLFCASFLAACSPRPTDPQELAEYNETNDRFEPLNRKFYAVNDTLDRYTLRPAARAYGDTVPAAVRQPIHNALANVSNPIQFSNDVLQGHPRRAGNTFMRFVINSTAGVLGFFDVAGALGYPDHDTDFGITLALWGVPEGPFLFLPVLGPTNPRDAVGFGMNTALDPFTWVGFPGSSALGYTRLGGGAVDSRQRVLSETDQITATALDPYATFRSLYRQHRQSAVDEQKKDDAPTVPAWYPRR